MGKPTAPAIRSMDNYSTEVAQAFAAAEQQFFAAGKPFNKDNTVNLVSKYGYFKVDTYENTSPTDIHYVVFFYNNATGDVFATHGTLARDFINRQRNKSNPNFLLFSDQHALTHSRVIKSIQNEGVLSWDSGTNQVTEQLYSTYKPARADTLIAFNEEYVVSDASTNLLNWRNTTLQKVTFRSVGAPFQILLHETAGMQMSESAVFKVPAHFCIGNPINGKGMIYQMADIASSVPHGEHTNGRAIGIEFVNAPFDIWKQIVDPNNPSQSKDETPRAHAHFKLNESTKGIYLLVEKINIKDLPSRQGAQFIPLEFAETQANDFFELMIPEAKLINKDALLAFKINNQPIATVNAGTVTLKYCKPLKFETLKKLVDDMEHHHLITQCDLHQKKTWQCVYYNPADKKTYYFYDKIFNETTTITPKSGGQSTKKVVMNFAIDLRLPAIFCHGHIGHHSDGFLQGIYLYLRIFEKLPIKGTIQSMIYLLTAAKTQGEQQSLLMPEVLTVSRTSEIDNSTKKEGNISVQLTTPISPAQVKPVVFIELDKVVIEKECPGVKTTL